MEVIENKVLDGGAFIIADQGKEGVFIPEEINEEQQMVKDSCAEFVQTEIAPIINAIDKQEEGLVPSLMEKAGELGLLGAHIPEQYGGMEMDTNTNTFISEEIGKSFSFSVTYAAHIGIGMLPILYFGTEAQKQKYLPELSAGIKKAAYCLTEPSSGSDALSAKTRADLSEDGQHYIINGQKMWITNGGFADVYIVFAQIDGDKFTGFIVEKGTPGLSLGAEEDKLGIKGSSTRQVFFEQMKIPADNILGEVGKGHLIAFNVLNIGRFKLGVLCMGAAKGNMEFAIKYANERIQFGKAISSFGAIQHKLAEQAIRTFAVESASYRVSEMLSRKKEALLADGFNYSDALLESAKAYAIECSILKVAGSDALDFVVDETVQIHGGNGFSEEYPAARAYRDARINRIFEGTNEINRMLMIDMLLKKAMQGELDIVGPAWEVQKELASMPSFGNSTEQYGEEYKAVKNFKKLGLMVAGAAAKQQMDGKLNLKHEQEILMNTSDILIDAFLAESLLLRVDKLNGIDSKKQEQAVYDAILKTFIHDATARIAKHATDALASFAEGDLLKTMLMGVKRYSKYPPQNVKNLRRIVAKPLIEANDYAL